MPDLCPNCHVPAQPGRLHCEACGLQFPPPASPEEDLAKESEKAYRGAVRFGRKLLIVAALLTVGLAQLTFSMASWGLDKFDQALSANPTREAMEFKAAMLRKTGVTWRQFLDLARRHLKMNYVVSLIAGLGMLGLWYWSQVNAFHALLTAAAISAGLGILDFALSPTTPACSLFVRGVFIVFLVNGALGARLKAGAAPTTPNRPPPKPRRAAPPPDDLGAAAPPPLRKRPAAPPMDDLGPVAPPPPKRPRPKA